MAKSRSKRKPKKSSRNQVSWSGMAARPSRRNNIILGVVAVSLLVFGAAYFWRSNQASNAFEALAATGQAALSQVVTPRTRGGGHLTPGAQHTYRERFPTSGIHSPSTVKPGFYDRVQAPTMLVHSIEHGHIVIYYDDPGAETIRTLREWTSLYDGGWDGVVAVPAPGLGQKVVLTAWLKRLELDRFEPSAAAAFIDAYRGRGPENPVR
jgi:hypothetical protein